MFVKESHSQSLEIHRFPLLLSYEFYCFSLFGVIAHDGIVLLLSIVTRAIDAMNKSGYPNTF